MDMYTQIDDPTPGGFIQDLSGKGNDAQVHGSPKFLRHDTGEMNALQFAPEDKLTVRHSASLDMTKQITIETWAQTTYPKAGYILLKKEAYGFPKFVDDDGKNSVFSYLRLRGQGGNPNFVVAQPEATDGKWHYFALTYDGKVIRYYLDGELSHEMKVIDAISSANTDIVIGHSDGWNNHDGPVNFYGKISTIRISNRARSPDEIQHAATVGKKLLRERDD